MKVTRSTTIPGAVPNQPVSHGGKILLSLLTGFLFFSWLGYLIYLVQRLPHSLQGGPVVLSRPQFLISDFDVVAQIDGLNDPVTIIEVVNPLDEKDKWKGKKVLVRNLERCRPYGMLAEDETPLDYRGPGQYILALRPTGAHPLLRSIGLLATPWNGLGQLVEGLRLQEVISSPVTYDVAPTPPSPGYPRFTTQRTGPPRIYPNISATRSQLEAIQKPK